MDTFAVLEGQASPGLLDSYQAERRPVAHANSALSLANWQEAMAVPRTLGLEPAAASVLQRIAASGPVSLLPRGAIPFHCIVLLCLLVLQLAHRILVGQH